MSSTSSPREFYDLFLSHGSPDKPWVRSLADELKKLGLQPFFDEREIQSAENFVLKLSDALHSRFLALILSRQTLDRPWVAQEWTSFLAQHGPGGRLVPILLDDVELPAILKATQAIDARDRDAVRVARELLRVTGRSHELPEGDVRSLVIGQDLVFTLSPHEDPNQLVVIDPLGQRRELDCPWRCDPGFNASLREFYALSRQWAESDAQRAELIARARTVGEALRDVLFGGPQGAELLQRAMIPGRPRPLVTVRSDDDLLLSLPWELLHQDGSFWLRDQRIDVARSTAGPVGPDGLIPPPQDRFRLLVNVSAPEGSGLHYEEESYRITRALTEQCPFEPTELGTLDDLADTAAEMARRHQRPPGGVHFSGHGLPGGLVFENDEGGEHVVPIEEVLSALRKKLDRLPPFFYLASCHGNTPAASDQERRGAQSSAAALHRQGVAQVVGYFGPVWDKLSTSAEAALYRALAQGHTTRYAVRQAREALARGMSALRSSQVSMSGGEKNPRSADRPAADGDGPSRADEPANQAPFAWAQLVFYHRGPDHPLSLSVDPAHRQAEEALRRVFHDARQRRELRQGFIGRRRELHALRRRRRQGQRVFVFQGLGGLGKSTLALHALPMFAADKKRICLLWCQDTEQYPDRLEALVGQLLEYCRSRFASQWEPIVQEVDRQAGDDSLRRFIHFLGALLANAPGIVLYFDNLESLLVGPEEASGDSVGSAGELGQWRSAQLRELWQVLSAEARHGEHDFYLAASCRYRNEDFDEDEVLAISPLPADALFRLTAWFPALQKLAAPTRARLVARLDGHPRSVEYADDLVKDALQRWKKEHGQAWGLPADYDDTVALSEWQLIVEPCLPQVKERLEQNLLLRQIWDRVLDDRARRMLFRMTLLRRSWDWALAGCLGEPEEDGDAAEATANLLRSTSLLEQVELGRRTQYTIHPATREFVARQFADDAALRLATHRRVGEFLEAAAKDSPWIETDLEAGHHLFQAGEYDRAYELLGPASDWLQGRGHVREGLKVLLPFLDDAVQRSMARQLVGRLLGTIGLAYSRLGQVKTAIGYYEQDLAIARQIGDRRGEGASLGNLGLAYAALGQVEKAIGHYEQHLAIAGEIGDRRGEGAALGNLGLAYAALGQVKKAIGYYEQQLAISRDVGERRGEGNALGNLGLAYARLGQVEKAIECYEQALEITREIGARGGAGATLGNLGNAYANLGQVEKAIGYYEQQLAIAREIGDRRGEGNALCCLGWAYAALGQVEKAIGYYEQALAIHREIGDRYGEALDLANLGVAFGSPGDVKQAIALLEQALQIGQEIKSPQVIDFASHHLEQLRQDRGSDNAPA